MMNTLSLLGACSIFFSLFTAASLIRADSSLVCNKKGWDAGIQSYQSIDYTNSYSYCATICQKDSNCMSFAYYLGNESYIGGDCELYNIPLKNNFAADDSSPFTFYDKGCAAQLKQCGVAGYSKIDSWISFDAGDTADCLWRCDNYGDGCISYAFGNGQCLLYTDLVAINVNADSSSPYIFNDHSCGQSSSTTIIATTTTMAKTSTKPQTTTTSSKTSSGFTTSTKASRTSTSTGATSNKASTTTLAPTSSSKISSTKSTTTTAITKSTTTSPVIVTTSKATTTATITTAPSSIATTKLATSSKTATSAIVYCN